MKDFGEVRKDMSVIVLEDNEGDFFLLEDHLIDIYKTVKVQRCETFSDFLQVKESKTDFDLIFLDLHLPDLSGIKLIENINSLKLNIPVIILTGYADLSLAKESLKLGVDDFLVKDEVSPETLHKSIEYTFSRNSYIQLIQAQNEKLRKIAWTQSHVVRAPLSRILGIINMVEMEADNEADNLEDIIFWLKQLRISCDEMDDIVRKLTEEAQQINLK